MNSILKPVKGDRFEIAYYDLTEEALESERFRDIINPHRRPEVRGQKAGTIVQLRDTEKQEVVMSDTAMERDTNIDLLYEAHGDVLIGGLGIGLVLLALQKIRRVASITVIELHKELVDLVAPQLPLTDKCNIVIGDVFTWKPPKGTKYNTIYMDIWNNVCGDNYEDMKTLRRRYGKMLDRTDKFSWQECWRRYETKQAHFGR